MPPPFDITRKADLDDAVIVGVWIGGFIIAGALLAWCWDLTSNYHEARMACIDQDDKTWTRYGQCAPPN